jgi:non-ribosomal peptide synthetase component E (peptide arylation enzyme)
MDTGPLHYEDLDVGQRWLTAARTVTEADIVAFAGLSGDFNPIHVDAEHAATTRFGDMENVLIEHPAVAALGVVGATIDGQSRIAAFVELTDGATGDGGLADELRAWCKERMRRYEYPHVVRFMDELPRTLTGKVQRFKLRELARENGR